MRIKLQGTKTKSESLSCKFRVASSKLRARAFNSELATRNLRLHPFSATLCALAILLTSLAPARSYAQQSSQPPGTTPTQTQQQPPAPQPSPTQLPPNAPGSTVRPSNDAQQSQQPQPVPEQQRQQTAPNTQGPRPETPQPPGGRLSPAPGSPRPPTPRALPATADDGRAFDHTRRADGRGRDPGSGLGTSGVAPAELPLPPPPISPDFRATQRPLPSAERVGVDVADQVPLTLNDAIRMALRNSNDIDASRIDVQIAEYNLTAARGVYDPVISSESYYERGPRPRAPRSAARARAAR